MNGEISFCFDGFYFLKKLQSAREGAVITVQYHFAALKARIFISGVTSN